MKYLPIFINLKFKKVLVFGGGMIAYRKIKLLLQCHANIHIISKKLCKKLFLYMYNKKVIWISMNYFKKYLKNVCLVVIATNNNNYNNRIYKLINNNKILINTVDNEKLCSFIFPSIVNRDPILIAVSSKGKSPVLTRIIREKIEILIPYNFGNIALLSGKFRKIIKFYSSNLSERRFFWESVFDSSFINEILHNNFKNAIQILYSYMINNVKRDGEVVLVGAGPGDSELLTIKGLQTLQRADIVLYDYLISRNILQLIRKDAKLLCVGKRFGLNSITQNEINELLIKFAKQGYRVVRLKGGDSFIFGRGVEELIAVKKAGIKFKIIPGITSAVGISASIGVPLTYRKYSSSVLFLTANLYKNSNINNSIIYSKNAETLVFYMCKTKIQDILKSVLSKGFFLNTPIVLVGFGTLLYQKVLFGQLKEIVFLSKKLSNPILLIIGKVVNLHKKLSWLN